jgi:hypothetical protein
MDAALLDDPGAQFRTGWEPAVWPEGDPDESAGAIGPQSRPEVSVAFSPCAHEPEPSRESRRQVAAQLLPNLTPLRGVRSHKRRRTFERSGTEQPRRNWVLARARSGAHDEHECTSDSENRTIGRGCSSCEAYPGRTSPGHRGREHRFSLDALPETCQIAEKSRRNLRPGALMRPRKCRYCEGRCLYRRRPGVRRFTARSYNWETFHRISKPYGCRRRSWRFCSGRCSGADARASIWLMLGSPQDLLEGWVWGCLFVGGVLHVGGARAAGAALVGSAVGSIVAYVLAKPAH